MKPIARRAARGAAEGWGAKSDTRFSPGQLAAFARVFARNTALRLGTEGAGLVAAASVDGTALTAALGLERLVGAGNV